MVNGTNLEQIVACPSLPTLPTIAVQLLELTRDPDVELGDIARLVESDPGLAARILRTVNSSLYGLRSPCASIQRALAYLGLNAVKSLVLGFSLVEITNELEETDSFDFTAFWRQCIYGAVASRHLAAMAESCDPDEAFTCGIFQNMGMLASFVALGDSYATLLRNAGEDPKTLEAAEQEQLGFTHYHAGAALGERWNFPPGLVKCLRNIPAPEQAEEPVRDMTQIVALGRIIADVLSREDPEDRLARIECLAQDWLHTEIEDVHSFLAAVEESAADLANVLDKDIGDRPDLESIRQVAEERSLEHQLAVQKEIDDLRRQRMELASAALTDGLTGVWNRKKFNEELFAAFEISRDTGVPFAIFFLDADHFKSLNDRFGHQIGDAVLIELARRIHDTVGSLGSVFRYGGEEFTAIVPTWDIERSVRFAELLRGVIESPKFDVSDIDPALGRLPVTVSIGVSAFELNDQKEMPDIDPSDIVQAADNALYEAKNAGRNCVRTKAPEASPNSRGQNEGEASEHGVDRQSHSFVPVRPLVQVDEAMAAQTADPSRIPGPKTRILLVENDALAAALLRAVFARQRRVELRRVAGLDEAKALFDPGNVANRFRPDVVLCEYNLGDGSGLDLLHLLRESDEFDSVPFMIMQDKPSDAHRASHLEEGANEVYCKEFMAENMSAWLPEFLAKWVPLRKKKAA